MAKRTVHGILGGDGILVGGRVLFDEVGHGMRIVKLEPAAARHTLALNDVLRLGHTLSRMRGVEV